MTVWLLVLLAVSQTNPSDVPGRIYIDFQTQKECEQALHSMTYRLKFSSYKVIGHCEKK